MRQDHRLQFHLIGRTGPVCRMTGWAAERWPGEGPDAYQRRMRWLLRSAGGESCEGLVNGCRCSGCLPYRRTKR